MKSAKLKKKTARLFFAQETPFSNNKICIPLFDSPKTNGLFNELTMNQKTDFSRYYYFYASYLASNGKINNASEIVNSALKLYPRNLLLNQFMTISQMIVHSL